MNDQAVIPVARPAGPALVPTLYTPPQPTLPPGYAPYPRWGYAMMPVRPRTDSMAVASAVCGFTGIIPIICQIAGLAFGILSLMRIRRSKLMGAPLGGAPWAIVGIATSTVGLLGWIGLFAGLSILGSSLESSSDLLQSLIPQGHP